MNLQQLIAKVLYLDRKLTTLKIAGVGSTPAWGAVTGDLSNQTDLSAALAAKQATLVSGTNIKTINSTSLLGSGDVAITGTLPAGSEVAGATLTLPGKTTVTGGNLLAGGAPVVLTESAQADFAAGTLTSTQANSTPSLSLLDAGSGTTKAISFNGSRSNAVTMAHNSAYNITGDITIEAWAKLVNPNAFSPVISKGPSGGTFDLVVQSGGLGYGWVRFGQAGSYESTEGSAYLKLNQWHHIAVTKSGSTLKFYVNGVLVKTTTFAPSVPTDSTTLTIGHAADSFVPAGYLFRGSLQEIRLWNVARTALEISGNMNSVLTGSETGLKGYWRLSEGTGTTIADLSPTGNNGTLSGTDYAWQTVTQNYATSGNRVSPVYDISAAKTISTSNISWTEVTPTGHTTVIQTRFSTDGGSSYSAYATCTNGSPIPGLSSTTDLSNGRLQIKQIFTSPTSKATPTVSDVSVSFTTPAFQYNLGVRTASPAATIDAGRNPIQGKLVDTGGLIINPTAPRYGAVADTGVPNDAALLLALADLGALGANGTNAGKIVFPRGVFNFSNDLELTHTVTIEGAGGDQASPGTTLRFAAGKGIKIPATGPFGGYGTGQGQGKGSVLRGLYITSAGTTGSPSSTVNVSGLVCTRTAGAVFQSEKWGGGQIVKIGSTYAKVASWDTDTQCTLTPLFYRGTVSGNTVTLLYGNPFPAGLTNVAVKIDGVSYNLHASTPSTTTVLTLSSSPAETGGRSIEIQSLGSLSSQTMQIMVAHGIEAGGTVHLQDVTIDGFPGNGIDLNTFNNNYDNSRNTNTCCFINALAINNEGHGLSVISGNSNASTFIVMNGFNNKGSGIFEASQFGNTYVGPHVDSNKMEAFFCNSSSSIGGLYSEGDQPPSRFVRSGGHGPVVTSGFHGAGFTFDTDAMILSDTGPITGITTLETAGTIQSGGEIEFTTPTDAARRINFGHGVSGSTTSGTVQEVSGSVDVVSNTYSAGGGYQTPTDAAVPSWKISTGGSDSVRIFRAPATGGTPSFALKAQLSSNGQLNVSSLALDSSAIMTKVLTGVTTLDFGSISSNSVATLDITVNGVAASDEAVVIVTPRGVPAAGLIWSGSITASNKVTVRLANITGSPIDPAATDWRATVIYCT